MFAEYAAQIEFRHETAGRARDQHVRELIADHLMPPPRTRPERLRAHAAALRASARRAWPTGRWARPIGLRAALRAPEAECAVVAC